MQTPKFKNKSTSTAQEQDLSAASALAWAYLEVDPAVHREEPLAVLHLDVPAKQQHREGADERGLPQVHAGVPDLHTREEGAVTAHAGIYAPGSHEPLS